MAARHVYQLMATGQRHENFGAAERLDYRVSLEPVAYTLEDFLR